MTDVTGTKDFDGKIAVVTGASSGIGREYARSLARGGASVTLAGRSTERLQQLDAAMFMLSRPRHVTIRDLVILPSAQQI